MSHHTTQQLVHASVHQLLLAPLGVSPVYDGHDTGPLLSVTDDGTALIIQTGCADGPVTVLIQQHDGPPEAGDPDGRREVQESVSLRVDQPLYLSSPTWSELHEPVLTPQGPGYLRIRVSGRGRGDHYDESVVDATEYYVVDAWSEPSLRPRELDLDDGVWS